MQSPRVGLTCAPPLCSWKLSERPRLRRPPGRRRLQRPRRLQRSHLRLCSCRGTPCQQLNPHRPRSWPRQQQAPGPSRMQRSASRCFQSRRLSGRSCQARCLRSLPHSLRCAPHGPYSRLPSRLPGLPASSRPCAAPSLLPVERCRGQGSQLWSTYPGALGPCRSMRPRSRQAWRQLLQQQTAGQTLHESGPAYLLTVAGVQATAAHRRAEHQARIAGWHGLGERAAGRGAHPQGLVRPRAAGVHAGNSAHATRIHSRQQLRSAVRRLSVRWQRPSGPSRAASCHSQAAGASQLPHAVHVSPACAR